jgi:hypothetical protein
VTPPRDTRPWNPCWRRAWQNWIEARQSWWLDWADDVRAAMNPDPEHELILGDDWYSVRYGHDVAGGFTPEFVRRFDAFSYDYTHGVHYLDPGMTNLDRDWAAVRELAGGRKATIFLKAAAKTGEPFPDAKWTLAHSERCLRNGVDGIDYYIYRAWKGNYAYRNGLADNPKVFREIAAFARANRG